MSAARSTPGATSDTTTAILTAVGGAVVTQLAFKIYETVTGSRYSKDSKTRLETLKGKYTEYLGEEPKEWALDDDNKPKYCISSDLSSYERHLSPFNTEPAKFYNQSLYIVKAVSAYLAARRKRLFGGGKPGDPLEKFMGEWIHFAVYELPKYKYDRDSIEKIKKRISYLREVRYHPALFKEGFISRKNNKFAIMDNIKQELLDCERLAEREALRVCAREKFDKCRDNLTALLNACAASLCYARQRPLDGLVFNAPSYLEAVLPSKNPNVVVLADIKKTPTGRMLQELLQLSGLDAVGSAAQVEVKEQAPVYFTKDYQPILIQAVVAKKHDLPKWVDEARVQECLQKTQALGESFLRLAKLKVLVEDLYDLLGMAGEVWAYGHSKGKLSLEGLLDLLEKEMALFKSRYTSWYCFHESLRAGTVNLTSPENKNFYRVTKTDDIEKFCQNISGALMDVKASMQNFSSKEIALINAKKKAFYQAVAGYFERYYSLDSAKYKVLEQEELTPEEKVAVFGLEEPIINVGELPELTTPSFFEKFSPGEQYSAWRHDYFQRQNKAYQQLANLLGQFEAALNQETAVGDLNGKAREIQGQLDAMRATAEAQRPAWRLGWFFLKAGWPFKQRLRKNVDLLMLEFELLTADVETRLEQHQKASSGADKQEAARVPFTKRAGMKTEVHYLHHKSTIFTLRSASVEGHAESRPGQLASLAPR